MLKLLNTYKISSGFYYDGTEYCEGQEIVVSKRHNGSSYWGWVRDDEDDELREVRFYEWEVANPEDDAGDMHATLVDNGHPVNAAPAQRWPPTSAPNAYPRRGHPTQTIPELTERFDEMVTRSLVATAQNMPEFPEQGWFGEAELTWESRPYVNTADSILREE